MVIMAKKNRNIETMTDEEFEKLLDEVAGERAEIQEPIIDPRFTERMVVIIPLHITTTRMVFHVRKARLTS